MKVIFFKGYTRDSLLKLINHRHLKKVYNLCEKQLNENRVVIFGKTFFFIFILFVLFIIFIFNNVLYNDYII